MISYRSLLFIATAMNDIVIYDYCHDEHIAVSGELLVTCFRQRTLFTFYSLRMYVIYNVVCT